MSKAPAFPFYARDFFGSMFVRCLPPWMRIYYLELLTHQWDNDGLPDDPEALRMTLQLESGWPELWSRLAEKFPVDTRDGLRRNPRLEEMRAHWRKLSGRRRKAGKEGAKRRWQTDSKGHGKGDSKTVAPAMAKAWPASASASASSREEKPSPGSVDATELRSWTGGAGTEPPEAPPPPGTERPARPEPSDFASQPEPLNGSNLASDEIAYLRSLPGQEHAGTRRSRAVR